MRAMPSSVLWFSMFAVAVPCVAPAGAVAPVQVPRDAGSATPIDHWQIQSAAKAQQGGEEISATDFSTRDWYPVSGRATVMAGLLENGKYPDVFHDDNLRAVEVPDSGYDRFVVPWWYRTQFTLPKDAAGMHTLLRSNGMIASADIWINGHEIADHASMAGAYPVREFDATRFVHAGVNTLALGVQPADAMRDFSMGWVDWNPLPPDNNMGPWRGVDIVRSGPVTLRFPHVASALSPDLARAALTVDVVAKNLDRVAHDVVVSGEAAGVPLQRKIHLEAGQAQTVSFSPQSDPRLALDHPKIWWPYGMGGQPLYDLKLAASVDGAESDRANATFGIRDVKSSLTKQGYRRFFINGKPLLIRGAGWAPDMFLRVMPGRMEAEFDYVRNLGLNTIRSEGKLEDPHFYDLAERYGVMILPGWECCDKWESAAKTGGAPWTDADVKIARESMASEARLLRNHPSVIGFLIGSDNPPPAAIAKMYVDTLHAEGWNTPIVSSATEQDSAVAGASGMKMAGPYAWVPPSYWYADKLGGAFGFDSEASAGAVIPRLEDVQRMLSPLSQEALWKYPEVRQLHATAAWSPFATLEPFDVALAKRYGRPNDLADYVRKAQLENYDNVRAQFEAFNAHMDSPNPSTGVIYWMLNNAWPSLHWNLYDWYMNPAGAYFGAKKANEPVHIQYGYDDRSIMLVNHTLDDRRGLRANVRVRALDGSVLYGRQFGGIQLAGNATLKLATLPALPKPSRTYFVELDLTSIDNSPVSRNVYWLSTQNDVLDWKRSNWYLTPVTQYADFTALQSLPAGSVDVRATTRHDGGDDVTTVTLTAPASAKGVALFQHLTLRRSPKGEAVAPILWSDNDVTLWPGESLSVTARYAAKGITKPVVEVSGWNVAAQRVPVDIAAH